MNIERQTGRDNQVLRMANIKRIDESVECVIIVDSKGFCLRRKFRYPQLKEKIKEFEKMDSELSGSIRLQDPYFDDSLTFECNEKGHVKVSGNFIEYDPERQRMEFCIATDQTCLRPWINSLEKI